MYLVFNRKLKISILAEALVPITGINIIIIVWIMSQLVDNILYLLLNLSALNFPLLDTIQPLGLQHRNAVKQLLVAILHLVLQIGVKVIKLLFKIFVLEADLFDLCQIIGGLV